MSEHRVDLLALYQAMARARAFEDALAALWSQGLISGEMHLGVGEEAVAAGVTAHLRPGDGVALDHRPTPVLALLGVDLVLMLKEMLGRADGLGRGRAGHMHLMSREHLAAASGIVGAAGPTAAGFALAAKLARRGALAVAFFGDGAANQGMLLESFNLAAAWTLPLVFVCKDNEWAITTRSAEVTGGDLRERAAAFGLAAADVDGLDAAAVFAAAGEACDRARRGKGPSFLRARCSRLEGHFLGDAMVRAATHPVAEGRGALGEVAAAAFARGGGGIAARAASVAHLTDLLRRVRRDRRDTKQDPLVRARAVLKDQDEAVARVDRDALEEVAAAVQAALAGAAP